eukprot:7377982-Prymnesium_polylepis.2
MNSKPILGNVVSPELMCANTSAVPSGTEVRSLEAQVAVPVVAVVVRGGVARATHGAERRVQLDVEREALEMGSSVCEPSRTARRYTKYNSQASQGIQHQECTVHARSENEDRRATKCAPLPEEQDRVVVHLPVLRVAATGVWVDVLAPGRGAREGLGGAAVEQMAQNKPVVVAHRGRRRGG